MELMLGHKHKDLTFWFQGPTKEGNRISCVVRVSCSYGLLGTWANSRRARGSECRRGEGPQANSEPMANRARFGVAEAQQTWLGTYIYKH